MTKSITNIARINRNERFSSLVKKKDVVCVLSNLDSIQCESAHIVPLNGEYGQTNYTNPQLLNDPANGMLLSKELHFLYDQFIWSINPKNYVEIDGIPKKRSYNIEVASNYKDKKLSINNYSKIILRSECHSFVEQAHNIFLHNWNPIDETFKQLKIKSTSLLYNNSSNISNTGNSSNSSINNDIDTFTTIDKLDNKILDQLDLELKQLIIFNKNNKKNFNKQNKEKLSIKYNLHIQSLESYYKKLKKIIDKRSMSS